jgi:acetyl esterase
VPRADRRVSAPPPVLDAATRRLVDGSRFPPHLYAMGPDDGRDALEEMQSLPPARDVRRSVRDVPTRHGPVAAHLFEPAGLGPDPGPVVVYAHGGGWTMGGPATHARFAAAVARAAGLRVLLVVYALTPEHRFPRPVEEVQDVVGWVRGGGLGPEVRADRVGMLGDCAGATLAAAVTLTGPDDARPAAVALLYPLGMPEPRSDSRARFAEGYLLRDDDLTHLWHEYVPRPSTRHRPAADPLGSAPVEPGRLPPTLVVTAEADPARDPAERFAARWRAAGAPVTCVRYLGVVHDFAVLDALRDTAPARAVVEQVGAFLATHLGQARP